MLFKRISKDRACPVCKNAEVYRVKRTGIPVKIACRVLNLRPQWCPECDTFFLGPRQSKVPRSPVGAALKSGENQSGNCPPAGGPSH